MRDFILIVLFFVLYGLTQTGCSSAKVRDLTTDPTLRVFLDPKIPPAHYVQIRRALVQSGKFEVVDRNEGFSAAIAEQERQHGLMGRRFSDQEKWSWVGEFYGAAAVITAHAQCYNKHNFWGKYVQECKQDLALINTVNGKVELAINSKNSEEAVVGFTVPDWDDAVEKLVKVYPKYFTPRVVNSPLDIYMEQSRERSRREREERSRSEVPRSSQTDLELIRNAAEQYRQSQTNTGGQ